MKIASIAAHSSPSWIRSLRSTLWTVLLVWSWNANVTLTLAKAQLPPPNDACVNATLITLGGSQNIIGDLKYATADSSDAPFYCGPDSLAALFGATQYLQTDPGLWYTFVGTGRRIQFHAQSIGLPFVTTDIVAQVYTGSSCGRTNLRCVLQFGVSPNSPVFTMATDSGVTYRMLVTDGSSTNTAFNVSTTVLPVINDNDVCFNAVALAVNSTVTANLSLATFDSNDTPGFCDDGSGDLFAYYSPSVWYSFVGTGRKVTAACRNDDDDCGVVVYTGSSCAKSALQCVAGIGRASGVEGTVPHISMYTQLGVTYRVLLVLREPNATLQIFVPNNDTFPNDRCSSATPIAMGVPFVGNLFYAPFQINQAPAQCTTNQGGLWYSFVGTGGRVTAVSACTAELNGDLQSSGILLFTGSSSTCSNNPTSLQCVRTFSVVPCEASPYTFETVAGTTYYMLVQREFTHKFNITLVPAPAVIVDNDVCAKATPLVVGTALLNNNITLATSDENDVAIDCACGNVTSSYSRGLWFSFAGTGGRVWADTCGTELFTRYYDVSVYQGSCGIDSLQCVTGSTFKSDCSNDTAKILFNTNVGTTYYILVRSNQLQGASFDVVVKSVAPAPVNDQAANATLTTVGSSVSADLAFATSDEDDIPSTCSNDGNFYSALLQDGFGVPSPGLWYRFASTGANVQVTSSCGSAYSLTNIHIYKTAAAATYTGPASLTCVTGFYNYCGFSSPTQDRNAFNFTTDAAGTSMYYMVVRRSNNGGASTTFDVKLESMPLGGPVLKENAVFPFNSGSCLVVSAPVPAPIAAPLPPPIAAPTVIGNPMAPPRPIAAPVVVMPTPVAPVPVPTPLAPAPVTTPLAPVPVIAPPPVPVTGTTPTTASPVKVSLPFSPPITAPKPAPVAAPMSPVRPPSSGRCRIFSLGCRVRRLLKAVFGIFN